MNMLKITIPGAPIPKHRPRFSKKGYAYNDQTKIMQTLSFIVRTQCDLEKPYDVPVKLITTFFMSIPKSLSKKKKALLVDQYHCIRPDIDNLEKTTYDVIVLSGVIIKDDCQIASTVSSKIWSDNPRTEIEIIPINYGYNKN